MGLLWVHFFIAALVTTLAGETYVFAQERLSVDKSASQLSGQKRLEDFDLSSPESISIEGDNNVSFGIPFAIAFDLGPLLRVRDNSQSGDIDRLDFQAGLSFRWPRSEIFHYEFGFKIFVDDLGGVHLGQRFIFDNSRNVRPQLKWAIASELSRKDSVSDLLSLDSLGLQVTLGVEAFVSGPTRSFRVETEVFFSEERLHGGLKLGWTWPIPGSSDH